MSIVEVPHPLTNRPALKAVLGRLHALSLEQERQTAARGDHYPRGPSDYAGFKDQLVALDEDKAQAMYLILRSMGATRVVEGDSHHTRQNPSHCLPQPALLMAFRFYGS
jgi:hypothetical protein